jgi:hypothetical protein
VADAVEITEGVWARLVAATPDWYSRQFGSMVLHLSFPSTRQLCRYVDRNGQVRCFRYDHQG